MDNLRHRARMASNRAVDMGNRAVAIHNPHRVPLRSNSRAGHHTYLNSPLPYNNHQPHPPQQPTVHLRQPLYRMTICLSRSGICN